MQPQTEKKETCGPTSMGGGSGGNRKRSRSSGEKGAKASGKAMGARRGDLANLHTARPTHNEQHTTTTTTIYGVD